MPPNTKPVVEAALFVSSNAVTPRKLANITDTDPDTVRTVLQELAEELEQEHRGIRLMELDGKYKLTVKEPYVDEVADLAPHQDISSGALRTLSVIAYNAPVEQKHVVDVRGNRAYTHIKELEERGLIRTEEKGRTKELDVTNDFLDYFELESLDAFKEYVDKHTQDGDET